jgi:two-component system sensor histidine kinase HydH
MLNAFQSMPDGGRLRVVLALEPGGDESAGRFVRLAVEDTGSGIGEEDLSRVFEPYFTTKKLGIGLGLALTKQIIEEHGGTIAITSRVGAGTTVSMRVPVGREEARG